MTFYACLGFQLLLKTTLCPEISMKMFVQDEIVFMKLVSISMNYSVVVYLFHINLIVIVSIFALSLVKNSTWCDHNVERTHFDDQIGIK